jgi:hypothetical protein
MQEIGIFKGKFTLLAAPSSTRKISFRIVPVRRQLMMGMRPARFVILNHRHEKAGA